MSSLTFASKQISIYMGIPVLIGGVLGGLLNIVIFLSLRTFRQSSCAFYLTVMSCANVGQLMTALLTRIMITGFDIDWTLSSVFYCKFRVYSAQVCALLSMTCYCLATIDQYFATCFRPRWHQWCNTKVASRLCAFAIVLWIAHGIPSLIYYDLVSNPSNNQAVCGMTNAVFAKYFTNVYQSALASTLPILISVLFGCLSCRNVRQLAHRTVPMVRRELDKQLTKMVIVQVLFNIFVLLPFATMLQVLTRIPTTLDPAVISTLQFVNSITLHVYYLYYAVSIER